MSPYLLCCLLQHSYPLASLLLEWVRIVQTHDLILTRLLPSTALSRRSRPRTYPLPASHGILLVFFIDSGRPRHLDLDSGYPELAASCSDPMGIHLPLSRAVPRTPLPLVGRAQGGARVPAAAR